MAVNKLGNDAQLLVRGTIRKDPLDGRPEHDSGFVACCHVIQQAVKGLEARHAGVRENVHKIVPVVAADREHRGIGEALIPLNVEAYGYWRLRNLW
ncbi:MAG: hypothetical protein ACYDEV_00400 [Acidiferrobacter sp.]